MNTLLVTEEYGKLTKGLFRVWSELCARAPEGDRIELFLNAEHWLHGSPEIGRLPGVRAVHALRFPTPPSVAARATAGMRPGWLAGGLRVLLRSLLTLVLAPVAAFQLAALVRRGRVDRLACHHGGWPAGPFVRWMVLASRLAGVRKCVLVIHSFPSPYSRLLRPLQRLEEWAIGRCAHEIATVSHACARALGQRNFRRPIRVVHNGMPAPEATGEAKPADAGLPVVGFLGALVPDKGAHVLLDAALAMRAPCRLRIAGPGDAAYRARLVAHPAARAGRVQFDGELADVQAFLRGIDLLVVPSIAYEAFGMVILEAMGHAKPVVCSDFGGMKEIVLDGVTGLVVPAGDAAALAAAIDRLLASSALRAQMGQAGLERLRKCFTAEAMAASHAALLA